MKFSRMGLSHSYCFRFYDGVPDDLNLREVEVNLVVYAGQVKVASINDNS